MSSHISSYDDSGGQDGIRWWSFSQTFVVIVYEQIGAMLAHQ